MEILGGALEWAEASCQSLNSVKCEHTHMNTLMSFCQYVYMHSEVTLRLKLD